MREVPLPPGNPYDRTNSYEFDLPATDEDEADIRVRELAGPGQREEARIQIARGAALTESRGFAMLAEFVEDQKQRRMGALLLTPITDANKDELNFTRGEVAGLMLALKLAHAIAEGATEVMDLYKEMEKLHAPGTDQSAARN